MFIFQVDQIFVLNFDMFFNSILTQFLSDIVQSPLMIIIFILDLICPKVIEIKNVAILLLSLEFFMNFLYLSIFYLKFQFILSINPLFPSI